MGTLILNMEQNISLYTLVLIYFIIIWIRIRSMRHLFEIINVWTQHLYVRMWSLVVYICKVCKQLFVPWMYKYSKTLCIRSSEIGRSGGDCCFRSAWKGAYIIVAGSLIKHTHHRISRYIFYSICFVYLLISIQRSSIGLLIVRKTNLNFWENN